MRSFIIKVKGLNKGGELRKISKIVTVKNEALRGTDNPKLFIEGIEDLDDFYLGKKDLEVQIILPEGEKVLPSFPIPDPVLAYFTEIVSTILVQLTAALK